MQVLSWVQQLLTIYSASFRFIFINHNSTLAHSLTLRSNAPHTHASTGRRSNASVRTLDSRTLQHPPTTLLRAPFTICDLAVLGALSSAPQFERPTLDRWDTKLQSLHSSNAMHLRTWRYHNLTKYCITVDSHNADVNRFLAFIHIQLLNLARTTDGMVG